MLRAAFGKIDITPPVGTPMGRLGINRILTQGVAWPLHLRAALFDDGASRIAIVALDQNFLFDGSVAIFREAIERATGVPAQASMVAATHSHNSPLMIRWREDDDGFARAEALAERLGVLLREMVARLAPARLAFAQGSAPGWSWNRRPIYRDDDGVERVGTHGPRNAPDFVRMEDADESAVRTLLALRPDGTTMGGVVNFWCHPTTMYGEPFWSADFPGPLLDRVEKQTGGDFVYLTGPAGDLSNVAALGDGRVTAGPDYCKKMGEAIADKVIESLASAEPVSGDKVRWVNHHLSIAQRMMTGEQVLIAREFIERRRAEAEGRLPETPASPRESTLVRRLYGFRHHFLHNSLVVDDWLAGEVVGMWELQKRSGQRVVFEQVEVQALGVGDFAMATFPGELFSGLGREVIARSPFRHTMAAEMTNGFASYLPPEEAFLRGGYECCGGQQGRLDRRAGRMMAEEAVRLLDALK